MFHYNILKKITQLKSLAKTTEAVNVIAKSSKTYKELESIGRSYTTETLKAALAQSTLNKEQIKTILSANGLQGELLETTVDELANAASTNLVAESQKRTSATTLGLGTAFKGLGIKIKSATASMLTWMATNPIGWITAVISAIGAATYGVIKLHDALTVSLEEQKEKLQETKEAYEGVKNELQEVESELQNTQNKIEELESIPNLTWVEQEELDRLREVTKELELQKQLKQDAQLESAEDLYKENKATFDKEFKSSYGNASVSDLKEQLSSGHIGTGQLDYGNITDLISALQYIREEKAKLTDESEIAEYDEFISDLAGSIKSNGQEYLSSLSEYKQNILEIANIRELTEDEQIFYDHLSSMQKMIYEFYSPATWNGLEFDSIFSTDGIEKTKEELIAMYQSGELSSAEMLESFPRLNQAIQESEIIAGESSNTFKEVFNEIAALAKGQADVVNDLSTSFDLTTYKDQIDDIQSSISTLRSALDSFNSGELSKIQVIDLMQQFPDLVPYIDLTADGFGNLSEGLSRLISQQPDSLIQSLDELKDSLSTEEERQQVELLIDSLQRLSSYGDTGIESYDTAIGNTWNDTANVIDSVTTQFENLAKVQEAVAGGLTMSANAAAELAKMYPEILTNAELSANGQITLNEDVVRNILDGDKSIVDAQITKLEADKAELISKKEFAEAQLEIVKQVGEGEGQISREVAIYKLENLNKQLQAVADTNSEEDRVIAETAENMAKNMHEFNTVVGNVAINSSDNMGKAAMSMADSMSRNSINAQTSLENIQKKAWDVADSIKDMSIGKHGGKSGTYGGGGSTITDVIKVIVDTGNFEAGHVEAGHVEAEVAEIDFDEFQTQLETDIQGYTDAISNIETQIDILRNLQAAFDDNGGIGGHGYADRINQLEKDRAKINDALKDSDSSAKSEFSETVDFFEERVKVLDNALSLLNASMDNLSGAFAKNNLVDAELGITEEKFNNYTDALSMYTQKANEAFSRLPADIASKVKDGAVALTDFIGDGNEDVVEAIKEYESWADEIAGCKQELAELQKEIRQLELEKFNNIMDDFSSQFNLRDDSKNLISKQVDLLKEAGELIGESFFKAQIDQSQKQLELLENEKIQLVNQMSSAISSGRVQKGTDEWLEMVNALSDVDGSILDCKKSIEGFDNELLNLHTEIFNRIQKQFSDLDSEISNIIDLFDDFEVSDDKGVWSKEAIAQLGLLSQQYELAVYQVSQYADEIDKLNTDYLLGKYSATEYADKLADLNAAQWDAVKSTENAKDAIMDLNETRVENQIKGIEKEIDAYKELTDAQIEALDAEKDLHEYQKSIADKNTDITRLEKQLAAMKNDNTASTVAKRKQLEEQLAEAMADLDETQYDHSVETQKKALNQQYEDFEYARNQEIEALRESLNDREAILTESFETVKNNAALVGQEIATIATEHGITISNTLISSWQSGENAIAGYGEVLSQNTSAFIGNIMGIENEVWNLQAQANTTADSLAWMFSAKADTLVNELNTSYYAESNLASMTNALQQSLINTLERGYDVSSIVNSLNAVTDAANRAKEAANNIGSGNVSTVPVQTTINNLNTNRTTPVQTNTGSLDSNRKYFVKDEDNKTMFVGSQSQCQTWMNAHNYSLNSIVGDDINAIDNNKKKDVYSSISTKSSTRSTKAKAPLKKYASGTRNAEDGLRIINEEGSELVLPKLSSGNYTVGNAGDQILTKEQTDNVCDWAKFNPEDYIPVSQEELFESLRKRSGNGKNITGSVDFTAFTKPSAHVMQEIFKNAGISGSILDESVNNNNNSVNIHYDSMITVNGSVNDEKYLVNLAKNASRESVKESVKQAEKTRKYGMF